MENMYSVTTKDELRREWHETTNRWYSEISRHDGVGIFAEEDNRGRRTGRFIVASVCTATRQYTMPADGGGTRVARFGAEGLLYVGRVFLSRSGAYAWRKRYNTM